MLGRTDTYLRETTHMKNDRFRKVFTKPHTFLPVIHVEDLDQALRNIGIALENGADGVFLINHRVTPLELMFIYKKAREEFPHFWLGVNVLGLTPTDALRFALTHAEIDGLWTDNVGISSDRSTAAARRFSAAQITRGWKGLYFGGTAFKYQDPVTDETDLKHVTGLASQYTDVVTTSGDETGKPPTVEKILTMRDVLDWYGAHYEGAAPWLAIASGMTPQNVHKYPAANCFLAFTGISLPGTENLDSRRVREFSDNVAKMA